MAPFRWIIDNEECSPNSRTNAMITLKYSCFTTINAVFLNKSNLPEKMNNIALNHKDLLAQNLRIDKIFSR